MEWIGIFIIAAIAYYIGSSNGKKQGYIECNLKMLLYLRNRKEEIGDYADSAVINFVQEEIEKMADDLDIDIDEVQE